MEKSRSRVKKSRVKGSGSKVTYSKELRTEIAIDNLKWGQEHAKQTPRGWVFGKQLKTPSSDKIRELVKKHEVEMNYLKGHRDTVKPYNISNYGEKNSIALAYISQSYPNKSH